MIKMLLALTLTATCICRAQMPFIFPSNTPDAYDRRPSGTTINRDATAIGVLQASVAAMGGLAALRAIPGWNIHLTVTQASNGAPHLAHWEVVGDQFRVEHRTADGSTMLKEITTGNGSAMAKSGTTLTPLPVHTIRSWIVPQMAGQLLQQALDNSNYSIDLINVNTQTNRTIVRTFDNTSPLTKMATSKIWYIDSTTMLPVQVCVRQYGPNEYRRHALITFNMSNFTTVDGILIPFHSSLQLGSSILETSDVSSVKINEPIPASHFSVLR